AANSGVAAVRAGVGGGRAAFYARRGVRAGEGEVDRVVVPAFVVRGPGRGGCRNCRRRGVVVEGEARAGGLSRVVGAAPARRRARRPRSEVGHRGRTRGDAGEGGALERDPYWMVVPAVGVGRSRQKARHRWGGDLDVKQLGDARRAFWSLHGAGRERG